MTSYYDAHGVHYIAAFIGVLSVALYFDVPEMCSLVGIIIYAIGWCTRQNVWQRCFDAVVIYKAVERLQANPLALIFGAALVACCFDFSVQLIIALLSALVYCALYSVGKRGRSKPQKPVKRNSGKTNTQDASSSAPWRRSSSGLSNKKDIGSSPASSDHGKVNSKDANLNAIPGLDTDIRGFVHSHLATRADETVARRLVKMAQKCILPVVPEAEVHAIPTGNLEVLGTSGSKPEIEMVVTVDPAVLQKRLKAYFLRGQTRIQKSLDTLLPDVLQKTATKVLSERLTFVRFWRSQFSGPEPMIVLLVPVELGYCNYSLRLNFAVNTPYPMRLATVLSKESMRAKELILLVTHWARERCIANTSRGQPHAYAWGLLVLHFLRQGLATEKATNMSTADMLKEFMQFYAAWFDSRETPLSVCFSSPATVQQKAEHVLWGIPYIEDPFDTAKAVSAYITVDGVARVKEELRRACAILDKSGEGQLAELLERWTPTPAAS